MTKGAVEKDCNKNKRIIKACEECIGCEGLCQKWFHTACVRLLPSEIKIVRKNDQLKWMFDTCNQQYNNVIVTSMKKALNDKMISKKRTVEKLVHVKLRDLRRMLYLRGHTRKGIL